MLSSDPNNKNSFHWRNDSGELDVFEAARYFSNAANDQNPGNLNGVNISQKFIREDQRQHVQTSAARMSLDFPMKNNPIPPEYHHHPVILDQKLIMKENTKYKQQPSSPGGRLASFLNSLFNQTHLKKKKKSKSGGPTKDFEDESPGARRKRRSSISHFRITTSVAASAPADDSKSSVNSGFRTPPPHADTPTKSYKELRNLSDHRQVISLSKNSGNYLKPTLLDELYPEKKATDYAWEEEKSRLSNGVPEKISRNGNLGFSSKNSTICFVDEDQLKDHKDSRKLSDADDGADSDSSSDLFDLPNHELDFYSSGLPVYETTHMDRIKIGKPISRATTV